ncbi:S8 family serine peptidase [Micromonospora chokoriensis]|uniref:S8 family serine peptidase n=1 Tax=Micromonospora chokoriensis TaxID=356851 RepID=UPI000A68BD18|nr:S8 family serine peptidase [Micromonospora chokoriensis]
MAAALGLTAQPVVALAAPAQADVDAQVRKDLAGKGSATFIVYLKEQAKLDAASRLRDADAQAAEVHQQLIGTADRTQAGLRGLLRNKGAKYTPFWIANAVQVDGDAALLNTIAARPEVAKIESVRKFQVVKPTPGKTAAKADAATPEWGVASIGAPRIWDELGDRGEGVVVANIDGGVQYDHPALVGKYRGNNGDGTFNHDYNWVDPSGVCQGGLPCDTSGHGTHTMGTMVGDDGAGNQVGVAPGAKWIAAKACEGDWCSNSSLMLAGQWMLAPTDRNGQNPRPDLRPDIINNSWGGGQGDLWYKQVVDAWDAAGIFAAFAAGNEGPNCDTVSSPGDYPGSYAVGGYNSANKVYDRSSRGTSSADGGIKPNISAPGEDVRSTWPGSGYNTISGTSMATPHVAGTVALMWSAAPSLRGDLAATEKLLNETATDVDATECGGTAAFNNVFGEGRLNAYQAVLKSPRGAVGRVSGRVTDSASGAPLVGVTIAASGAPAVTTGTDGDYTLALTPGEHTVTATAYGYVSRTVTVTVAVGSSRTENFALAAQPMVTVSGKVADGSGHGWPLYAKIDVSGRPGGPVFTDPITGNYSFSVPANTTHTLVTTSNYAGYRKVTSTVQVADVAKTANIKVPVDHGCTTPGYAGSFSAPLAGTETFDGTSVPAGWSVVDRTSSPAWAFNDPGNRGNHTGGSGNFAVAESSLQGDEPQDSDLISPTFNLAGTRAPYLRFNSDLLATSPDDMGDVDVSVDGGTSWQNVWHGDDYRQGPKQEVVPLEMAAGATKVKVRFRYQGYYAWWWGVDNVEVVDHACTPTPASGLVAGFVTDKNTGDGVNGVAVASPDAPAQQAVTEATPADPNIGDGFYWLLSTLTGTHTFEAAKRPYQTALKDVTVVADRVNKANIALKVGRVTVSQTGIEVNQPYGSTRSTTVTVKNTGSAPATVEVLKRAGQPDGLTARKGAALVEQPVSGITRAMTGGPVGASGAKSPSTAPQASDSAWRPIANAPAQITDNAAVSVGGKVYSIGGGAGSGAERSLWRYDPDTSGWSALAEMPRGRSRPSAAVVNGKIYVLGGWSATGSAIPAVDVFDPKQGTWSTLVGTMNPVPRAAAGTAVVDGKIVIVGGCADGDCVELKKDVVLFDPSARTFSAVADYPLGVAYVACGGIGSGVYCAGGAAEQANRSTYGYDPTTNVWTQLPDLPIDLWGSQTAVASNLLVVSGGVTSTPRSVTNRTVAYDPGARAWRDLPNVQVASYRGAMACGLYKFGGFQPNGLTSEAEHLSGYGGCDTADAPWLETTPATFTLAAGASKTITVTVNATAEAGIAQPGAYRGEFGFKADTPYPVSNVGVNVGVTAPADWGKIQGTVTGLTCAGQRLPLAASVRLNLAGTGGKTGYTVQADAQGHYVSWLPAGTYQALVSRDGWTASAKRQTVSAGFTLTYDVTLDPASPCGARLGGI